LIFAEGAAWNSASNDEKSGLLAFQIRVAPGELCATLAWNSVPRQTFLFKLGKFFLLAFIFDKGHVVKISARSEAPIYGSA